MTTGKRPPFMPVSPEFDDDVLERLASDKGVGAMVKPAARAEQGAPPPAAVSETAAPDVPRPSPKKGSNLELPTYLWTDLKIRAAQTGTSARYLIMTALRKDGFEIADIDMAEDGRRNR